jgi:hypothetical protein
MAASLWLQLPAPPAAVHNPVFLSGKLSSSLLCKNKKHPQAARGSILCSSSSSSSNSSASVVTKEQEAVAAASSSQEEGVAVSETEFVSYRDDPNFR